MGGGGVKDRMFGEHTEKVWTWTCPGKVESIRYAQTFLVPGSAFLRERVGENDAFAHDGGDGEFWRLAGIYEALVESLEVWVEARGDEGRHIDQTALNRDRFNAV